MCEFKSKSGGAAKGPGNMDHLVAAGIARAVQGFDEKGNPVMKYEPIANPLYAGMAQQQQNSGSNSIEWARLFLETMNATLARQSEMPKFAESLLNNFIQKMPMQTDPIEQIVNTKKVLDTIAPQTGASAMNLDVAKYNLAQERLKTDREFAMMAAQREHEKMMYERQRDERMEQASSQNMSEIVKSVFSIGKEAFVPLLMMLTQGKMPGGMPGMVPPGMVAPGVMPQQQPMPQPTVQPVNRVPRPRPRPRPTDYSTMEEDRFAPRHAAPASNDQFGYGRPQPQPQVVQNTSGTVRQYSPQDFANMDLATLETLAGKGYNSRASIDSFNSAVQAAIAQKRIQQRQEPITQYQASTQQPIVQDTVTTTTQTTTETITTDDQTAADLKEAMTEDTDLKRPQEETATVGDIAE